MVYDFCARRCTAFIFICIFYLSCYFPPRDRPPCTDCGRHHHLVQAEGDVCPPPPKNCKRLVEASPSSAPAQSHITHWHLPTPPKATGATERTHRRPLSGLTQSPKAVPSTFITHVGTSSPFRPHSLKAATRRVSPSSPVPYARHLTHSLILINRHFGENIARICGPWALTLTRLFARLRLRQAPGSGFQGPSGLLSIASFAKHLDDRRRGSN